MRSRDSAHRVKWWQDVPLIGLWALFAVTLVAMIVVSSIRQLSQLEVVLFQVVTLATGLLGHTDSAGTPLNTQPTML